MNEGIKTIIYPVKDIEQAKARFTELLGLEPVMDEVYYVGYRVGGQDVGLDPNGHSLGMTGPVAYWHVDDIRARIKALVGAGAETLQDVKDVGGGKLNAILKDADGNVIGLIQEA